MTATTPKTLTSKTVRSSSRVLRLGIELGVAMPALLICGRFWSVKSNDRIYRVFASGAVAARCEEQPGA